MSKKQSTAVALSQTSEAPDVMAAMEEELKQLEIISTTPWKTGNSITFTLPDGSSVDIKTEKEVNKLVQLYVVAKRWIEMQEMGYTELGIKTHPVINFQGATLEDIKTDIELKIKINSTEERRTELKAIFEEAKQFISKEQQYQMFLKRANKVLGKQGTQDLIG